MVTAQTSSSGDTISEVTEVDLGRDLDSGGVEAEAWSITVDKKTLKKMTPKDIKRQDTIWGECRPLKKKLNLSHIIAQLTTDFHMKKRKIPTCTYILHSLLSSCIRCTCMLVHFRHDVYRASDVWFDRVHSNREESLPHATNHAEDLLPGPAAGV